MTDILDIVTARKAIELPDSDLSRDAELQDLWIPAVTGLIEDIVGAVYARTETLVHDGGTVSILLPDIDVDVTEVTENGVTLTEGTDYSVNAAAGIVRRGTQRTHYRFHRGSNNVVITYSVGTAQSADDVPAKYVLAASIILANLWQNTKTAYRPAIGGSADDDTSVVPTGYAVPNKALELLGSDGQKIPAIG
jgi:hypothetical protein